MMTLSTYVKTIQQKSLYPNLDWAVLEYDGQVMGHLMSAFVPKNIIGKDKPYYDQVQNALSVVPHEHIKLHSCAVVPESNFLSELMSLLYERHLEDESLCSYYSLTKSHTELVNNLLELYGGESIFAHHHPTLDLLARFYLFPRYTTLLNPLIRQHYLTNHTANSL